MSSEARTIQNMVVYLDVETTQSADYQYYSDARGIGHRLPIIFAQQLITRTSDTEGEKS